MGKHLERSKIISVFNDRMIRIFLLLLVVLSVFPFIYMFLISLMETNSMKLSLEKLLNAQWTLGNYKKLLEGGNFGRYLLNSTIISVYACVVTCLVSSMAAYAFAKKRFVGRDPIYLVYLFSMMIPGQAVLIPQFLIVRALGLLDTYTGIVIPMFYAYGVVMMRSFVKNIPDDLIEAADIDGCSEVRKFTHIILPLMKPAIISLAIWMFFNVWGNLIWPLIIASGDKMTVTQAISSMRSGMSATDYGYVMAGTTVAFLPPFILYLILQKQFVEGIAVSGIKG